MQAAVIRNEGLPYAPALFRPDRDILQSWGLMMTGVRLPPRPGDRRCARARYPGSNHQRQLFGVGRAQACSWTGTRGSGAADRTLAASSCSTASAVDGWPLGVFLTTGRPSLLNRYFLQLGG